MYKRSLKKPKHFYQFINTFNDIEKRRYIYFIILLKAFFKIKILIDLKCTRNNKILGLFFLNIEVN